MAPLFKVTIEASVDETFYVRAESDDFARDIAMEHALRLLDDSLGYISLDVEEYDEVEEGEEGEYEEYEVLS